MFAHCPKSGRGAVSSLTFHPHAAWTRSRVGARVLLRANASCMTHSKVQNKFSPMMPVASSAGHAGVKARVSCASLISRNRGLEKQLLQQGIIQGASSSNQKGELRAVDAWKR